MHRLSSSISTLFVGALAAALASCAAETAGPTSPEHCGAGTTYVDGRCDLADDGCGEQTELSDGVCVPAPSACAEGTTLDPETKQCEPDAGTGRCGALTEARDGVCYPSDEACAEGSVLDPETGICVVASTVCGDGTTWDATEGRCKADPSVCAGGSTWSEAAGECVRDDMTVCGAGTSWDETAGACVADGSGCGSGTSWDADAGQCVVDGSACGAGTSWDADAGACVAGTGTCGAGTSWDASSETCVIDTGGLCGAGTAWDATSESCVLTGAACGAGTSFDATSGTCVVDTAVCGPGTVWDDASGGCVADPTICGAGTAFDSGTEQCLPTSDVCAEGTSWDPDARVCRGGGVLDGDCVDPMPLPDPIDVDTTLPAGHCYILDGVVHVTSSARLIIEPGVTLRARANAGLDVDGGYVLADGTSEAPIRVEGTTDAPGHWRGIRFHGDLTGTQNVLRHVVLRNTGSTYWAAGDRVAAVLVDSEAVSLLVDSVTFFRSAGWGLQIVVPDAAVTVEASTFDNNVSGGADLLANQARVLAAGNTFVQTDHAQWVRLTGTVSDPQTWASDVPWMLEGIVLVDAALTIAPGATLTFREAAGLHVRDALLTAAGTVDAPITFTGGAAGAQQGHWRGIGFDTDTIDAVHTLAHVVVENAGHNYWYGVDFKGAVVVIDDSVALDISDSTLRDNAGYGLRLVTERPPVTVTRTSFARNAAGAARMPPNRGGVFDATNAFSEEGSDPHWVWLAGGSDVISEQTWAANVPLHVEGATDVTRTLTLEPGADVVFGTNAGLRIDGGALLAVGTAEAPISLRGVSPAPGVWRGISFWRNSVSPINTIAHATIRDGGGLYWQSGTWRGNVVVEESTVALAIRDATLTGSGSYGLRAAAAADLTVERTTFTGSPDGSAWVPADLGGAFDDASTFDGSGGDPTVYLEGHVTRDQTWPANVPFEVMTVSKVTADLTLAPGASVAFDLNAGFEVTDGGNLVAAGTSTAPISLIGSVALPGWWRGVLFGAGSAASALSHVEIAHGGGAYWYSGTHRGNVVVPTNLAAIAFDNATLHSSETNGIYVTTDADVFTGCANVDIQDSPQVAGAASTLDEICRP